MVLNSCFNKQKFSRKPAYLETAKFEWKKSEQMEGLWVLSGTGMTWPVLFGLCRFLSFLWLHWLSPLLQDWALVYLTALGTSQTELYPNFWVNLSSSSRISSLKAMVYLNYITNCISVPYSCGLHAFSLIFFKVI